MGHYIVEYDVLLGVTATSYWMGIPGGTSHTGIQTEKTPDVTTKSYWVGTPGGTSCSGTHAGS